MRKEVISCENLRKKFASFCSKVIMLITLLASAAVSLRIRLNKSDAQFSLTEADSINRSCNV